SSIWTPLPCCAWWSTAPRADCPLFRRGRRPRCSAGSGPPRRGVQVLQHLLQEAAGLGRRPFRVLVPYRLQQGGVRDVLTGGHGLVADAGGHAGPDRLAETAVDLDQHRVA